jgi:hypothetical protein
MATPRSISVGEVRLNTSDPVILRPIRLVPINARNTTRPTPEATVRIERRINSLSNTAKLNERLTIGDIRGAMIIAPIIAGALFAMRPNVAIVDDRAIIKKNPKEGTEAACIIRPKSSDESAASL